jgi:hypothetical protein
MADSKPTVKVTLKNEQYELTLDSLTGRERLEAKRLLEVPEFHTSMLIGDEIGVMVLAYLAAKRVTPSLSFDAVLDLTGSEITIDFSAFDAPDGDEHGPFDGSATKASRAKTSSAKASSEA